MGKDIEYSSRVNMDTEILHRLQELRHANAQGIALLRTLGSGTTGLATDGDAYKYEGYYTDTLISHTDSAAADAVRDHDKSYAYRDERASVSVAYESQDEAADGPAITIELPGAHCQKKEEED